MGLDVVAGIPPGRIPGAVCARENSDAGEDGARAVLCHQVRRMRKYAGEGSRGGFREA